MAPTCESFKRCWATRISRPHKFIPTLISNVSKRYIGSFILARRTRPITGHRKVVRTIGRPLQFEFYEAISAVRAGWHSRGVVSPICAPPPAWPCALRRGWPVAIRHGSFLPNSQRGEKQRRLAPHGILRALSRAGRADILTEAESPTAGAERA